MNKIPRRPIIEKNLIIMTQTILNLEIRDKIFGNIDYLKLRSSMTLFKLIAEKQMMILSIYLPKLVKLLELI